MLRLVGIGYRASIDKRPQLEEYPGQDFVCLRLGFSHPIDLGVPKGVTASTPQPTRILLEGINREEVMQFAAKIRRWRVPEPYKGKGIIRQQRDHQAEAEEDQIDEGGPLGSVYLSMSLAWPLGLRAEYA